MNQSRLTQFLFIKCCNHLLNGLVCAFWSIFLPSDKTLVKILLKSPQHLFFSYAYPIQGRRGLKPIPAAKGWKAGYSLDRLPLCHRANTDRQTPFRLIFTAHPYMSLGCGRKLKTRRLNTERPKTRLKLWTFSVLPLPQTQTFLTLKNWERWIGERFCGRHFWLGWSAGLGSSINLPGADSSPQF